MFNHAITLSTVGTYRHAIEGGNADGWHGPLPWDKAIALGHYNLNDHGELKPKSKKLSVSARTEMSRYFSATPRTKKFTSSPTKSTKLA